jgi:hypothetical protein
MALPVRKTLTSAGIAVLALLTIADTSSAPIPEFVMGAHHAGSKVLAQSLRADNQLVVSLGGARERFEPSWTARRGSGGVAKPGDDAQNAFLDTWSTGSATELGDGGNGGDSSNVGGGASLAASPAGWPGGLAGQAGAGITGPGSENRDGGSPKSGDDPVRVPEPTSLPLVVFGLAAFGIFWMRAPELPKQRISRR